MVLKNISINRKSCFGSVNLVHINDSFKIYQYIFLKMLKEDLDTTARCWYQKPVFF